MRVGHNSIAILLAGMDKVTASVGEFLRAGEPVGEMGSGPASVTLFGEVVPDGRPVLYIEFRDGTDAIDSGPWWIGGLKEALSLMFAFLFGILNYNKFDDYLDIMHHEDEDQ